MLRIKIADYIMHKSNKIIKLKKIRYADTKDNFLSFILIVKRKVIYWHRHKQNTREKCKEDNISLYIRQTTKTCWL